MKNSAKPESENANVTCTYCKAANHSIYKCFVVENLSHDHKRQFVNSHKLCYNNCLGFRHNYDECTSQGCLTCSRKHHTLLHIDTHNSNSNANSNSNQNSNSNSQYRNHQNNSN